MMVGFYDVDGMESMVYPFPLHTLHLSFPWQKLLLRFINALGLLQKRKVRPSSDVCWFSITNYSWLVVWNILYFPQ